MIISSSSSWNQLKVVASLKRGDKLAVDHGRLICSPAGFLQGPTRTIKNMTKGGYNRTAVANHCNLLMIHALSTIKGSPQSSYEDLNLLKEIRRAFRELQFTYSGCDGARFQTLSLQANTAVKIVKTRLNIPKERTVESISEKVELARTQIVPLWKRVGAIALDRLLAIPVGLPLMLLTGLKWVVWNPFEFLIRGRLTTQNPLTWFTSNMVRWKQQYTDKRAEQAIVRCVEQLIHAPLVTEEHLRAFFPLAKEYVKAPKSFTRRPGADFSKLRLLGKEKGKYRISFQHLQELVKSVASCHDCQAIKLPPIDRSNYEYLIDNWPASPSGFPQVADEEEKRSLYGEMRTFLDNLGFQPKSNDPRSSDRDVFIRK